MSVRWASVVSVVSLLGAGAAASLGAAGSATGDAVSSSASASAPAPAPTARYPYDPACPWGRVSNGRGIIVRCISEEEAQALLAAPPPSSSGSAPEHVDPPPAASGSAATSAPAPPGPPPAREEVRVTVGPVTADQGTLPQAEKRLSLARARFAQCFEPGSLRAATGEVHVRFLVRPRGRAEGVSVARRVNVSPKAARCVADVVDRRYVGTPEAPVVGATVVVQVARVIR